MVERLLIVLALAAVGVCLYRCVYRRQMARARHIAPTDPLLQPFQPGVPAIVYFTTPFCVPCQTQQGPTIQRLQTELGERVQVFRIDASSDPAAAERWGVFSAPTTFILDGGGQPLAVNHGVADGETLRRQLGQTNV